jgi:Protein of unknown function (DUF1579)
MKATMRLRALMAMGLTCAICGVGWAQESAGKKEAIGRLAAKLEGRWAIEITMPGSEKKAGAATRGEEVFERGPGEHSFVEKYHAVGTEGKVTGLGIYWWSEATRSYQIVWCDNEASQGCSPMSGGGKWEGENLVVLTMYEENGKKKEYKEVFSDFTANSFTQTVYERPEGGEWKVTATIHAKRVKGKAG